MGRRHPIQCIIPPRILEELALNGPEEKRRSALETLAVDASVRTVRVHNAVRRSVAPPTAELVGGIKPARPEPKRAIYDCHNERGGCRPTLVRSEGQDAVDDDAVNEAYEGLGDTFYFYRDAYERDSLDDRGRRLEGWVHYDVDYDNAFWNGEVMAFGDGDLFKRLTLSLDVIGHELTHGVVENTCNLQYQSQPGALNESCADVFGSLVKQFKRDQSASEADWLIGADIVTDAIPPAGDFPKALRSMKDPGNAWADDDQPAKMEDYVETRLDNGGVHINSGIPNHAFYIAATRLEEQGVEAKAWKVAGRVWYETMRGPNLTPTSNFRDFARATLAAARQLYGREGQEYEIVQGAWEEVGVPTE